VLRSTRLFLCSWPRQELPSFSKFLLPNDHPVTGWLSRKRGSVGFRPAGDERVEADGARRYFS
jgi:hypothetical protein